MQALSILLTGFSVFAALVLILTHFRRDHYKGQRFSQAMGIVLLLVLAALQLAHFAFFYQGSDFIHSTLYQCLLFAVAPAFYFFSRPLLQAGNPLKRWHSLHLLPPLLALLLPFTIALPAAFAVGALYLLWLASNIYRLRAQRDRFRLELAILAAVFVIAIIVMLLGLGLPVLSEPMFFNLYASAIGLAFLLVSIVLGLTPQLSADVSDAAYDTYAVSTLNHVDTAAALAAVESLMQNEQLFRQADLNLGSVATQVKLNNHQLSELINTQLGKSFSRYIREHRVAAAKQLLLEEPSASVLSIGMSVGFTSQSNFYQAFREITGTTPGQFRKLSARNTPQ